VFRWLERILQRRSIDDDDVQWLFPPETLTDPDAWDEFWRRRAESPLQFMECYMFAEPAEIGKVLAENGLTSVLCVGSGPSVEPWMFARAGYDVTVLELSPFAVQKAQEEIQKAAEIASGPCANLQWVVGDLMNPDLCPGPFDLILERKTLQMFARENRLDTAMTAVVNRLNARGIFFSHCHDGGWKPPAPPRNATRAWFESQGWHMYRPPERVEGRVAWTFTSTG
jgi:Methyltransferase domain